MVIERAGAASLRMKVFAVPFVAFKPTLAVGFAPVEVETATPRNRRSPETFIFVEEMFNAVKTPVNVDEPNRASDDVLYSVK